MKSLKVILPLTGVLMVGALILQTRGFEAKAAMAAMMSPSRPSSDASSAPTDTKMSGLRITAEGRVTTYPGSQVTVGTDTAGTVMRLLVDEKSIVRKGDLIAELRSDDLRAAITQAKARVGESEADIKLYETEVRRAESLYESQVGTKQTVDRSRRDLDSAIARRETSISDARRLEALWSKSVVRSPINGTVIERHAQPGETLREQGAIVTIADLKKLRVEAEVDEFDAGRVKLGAEVIVRAEGYDHQQWKGRVEEIPDAVVSRRLRPEDPGRPTDTRVLLVKVAIEAPAPLKLGQRVEVEIKR